VLCVGTWFSASICISFANKRLLGMEDFHFPFFVTFVTNAGVAFLAFVATRVPALRQPAMPRPVFCKVVVPMSAATTLDLGFSNWGLIYLDVAFHVIIKGGA
jgi:hypothetical protein